MAQRCLIEKGRALLVDDDPDVAAALAMLLETLGWEVRHAATARQAYVEVGMFSPDVVLLDVGLPDASGIDVLQQIKDYSEDTPVIVISGAGSVDRVIDSMKHGALTFLQKPFDADVLNIALEQVANAIATQRELAAAERREKLGERHQFLGISMAAQSINEMLGHVANASSPVLLEGESGTGKGVLARLIHDRSARSKAPFVDLNCAGLSKELLESELFGHERGAFTSATATKQGLFEVASGGTLFLDEIGEMDVAIQARLLKALEDRRFRRVGGVRDLQADFRLIAATNRTLRDEVAKGSFRKDLYYRLNVITMRVPPLRERLDDIPILAQHLVARLSQDLGRKPPALPPRTLKRLAEYPWPGNVRELRNVLERAMLISATRDEIRANDLLIENAEAAVLSSSGGLPTREWEIQPLERLIGDYAKAAVDATGGNVRKAARLLQISPSTLYAKLRESGQSVQFSESESD